MTDSPFVIVYDQKRTRASTVLYNAAMLHADELIATLIKEDCLAEFMEMMKEITDSEHDRGWCPDPECEYKEEAK